MTITACAEVKAPELARRGAAAALPGAQCGANRRHHGRALGDQCQVPADYARCDLDAHLQAIACACPRSAWGARLARAVLTTVHAGLKTAWPLR